MYRNGHVPNWSYPRLHRLIRVCMWNDRSVVSCFHGCMLCSGMLRGGKFFSWKQWEWISALCLTFSTKTKSSMHLPFHGRERPTSTRKGRLNRHGNVMFCIRKQDTLYPETSDFVAVFCNNVTCFRIQSILFPDTKLPVSRYKFAVSGNEVDAVSE